jgi:hypothetical protein
MPSGLGDIVRYLDARMAAGEKAGQLIGGGLRLAGHYSVASNWLNFFMAIADIPHKVIHLHLLLVMMFLMAGNAGYDPIFDAVLLVRVLVCGTPASGKSYILARLAELVSCSRRVDHKTHKSDTTDEDLRALIRLADEADASLYGCAFKDIKELLSSVQSGMNVRSTGDFRQDFLASMCTQIRMRIEGIDMVKEDATGVTRRAASVTQATRASADFDTMNWPVFAMSARLRRRFFFVDVDEAPRTGARPSSFQSNMVGHASVRKEVAVVSAEWTKKVVVHVWLGVCAYTGAWRLRA